MATLLEPQATDPIPRLLARIAALEARVAGLETGVPIPVATPSGSQGTNGNLAVDATPRLWVKVGGAWYYTALT
jgi:hypothetical protein